MATLNIIAKSHEQDVVFTKEAWDNILQSIEEVKTLEQKLRLDVDELRFCIEYDRDENKNHREELYETIREQRRSIEDKINNLHIYVNTFIEVQHNRFDEQDRVNLKLKRYLIINFIVSGVIAVGTTLAFLLL